MSTNKQDIKDDNLTETHSVITTQFQLEQLHILI